MGLIQPSDVPASLLMKVTMVNDIRNAKLLTNKERIALMNSVGNKDGRVKDVLLSREDGKREFIYRSDLVKIYRLSGNKKIKLYKWHNDKTYLVIRFTREPMLAIRVPKKSNIEIDLGNGKVSKPGWYVVFNIREDGCIDDSKEPMQLSPRVFKKSFHVDSIYDIKSLRSLKGFKRVKGVKLSKQDKQYYEHQNQTQEPIPEPVSAQASVPTSAPTSAQAHSGILLKNNHTHQPSIQQDIQPITKQVTDNKYKIVSRLINNSDGKLVGFVISNGKQESEVNLAKTMGLCSAGRISNATVVNRDGKSFIRGIGEQINSLPERRYNYLGNGRKERV